MRMDSGLNLRLKEARELRGWTVEKAANLCGVTARTFVDWEAGKKAPRVSRLITLAGVLGHGAVRFIAALRRQLEQA